MSKLAMIIYTADKISDDREFDTIKWIREISKVDIEMAFVEIIKVQYEYLRKKYGLNKIDKNTLSCYRKYVGDKNV